MSTAPDAIVVAIDPSGAPISTAESAPSTLQAQWAASRASADKAGQLRVFYPPDQPVIVAVSLGKDKPVPTTAPDTLPADPSIFTRNEKLERTRLSIAKAARAARDAAPVQSKEAPKGPVRRTIAVDSAGSPHASAVGAHLALWQVNAFKTRGSTYSWGLESSLQGGREIEVLPLGSSGDTADKQKLVDTGDVVKDAKVPLSWWTGEVYAKAQNWARELMETPANLMTPTIFCDRATAAFKGLSNVELHVRDEAWAKAKKMNTFLSVAAGTDEPAKLLEIHYRAGGNSPTLAFVGKGITFDSGGISIKGGAGMKLMRADMGGAACCVASALAIAQLGLPLNLVCVTPLTENMPSGKATKPGDIIESMKGLTVEVDNTDAEGRLVLADALTYISREFAPHTLLDVATLTGAMLHALGHVYTGTFVEDESLWQELKEAGEAEHDRFWRMPLSDDFMYSIAGSNADLCNRGTPAGSACAAIFLKQFVENLEDREKLANGEGKATVRYAHLDIAGTMESDSANDYQARALTGRPTRSLIEFARRFGTAHRS